MQVRGTIIQRYNIESIFHYPLSVHKRETFHDFSIIDGGCSITEQATSDFLSILFHPYLDEHTR